MNGTAPPPGTPPVPPPSVSGGRPPMSAAGKIGVALAALVLLAVLYWLGSASGSSAKNEDGVGASAGAAGTIRRIEPLPPPPPEPMPVAMPAPAAAPAPRPIEIAPRPRGPRQTIRPAPVMGYEAQGGAREDAAMPAASDGRGRRGGCAGRPAAGDAHRCGKGAAAARSRSHHHHGDHYPLHAAAAAEYAARGLFVLRRAGRGARHHGTGGAARPGHAHRRPDQERHASRPEPGLRPVDPCRDAGRGDYPAFQPGDGCARSERARCGCRDEFLVAVRRERSC